MTNCNEINIEAGRLKSIFGKCYNLKAIDLRDVVDLIESVNSCANGSFQLKTVNGQSLFGSGNIVVTATVDGTETKLQQGTGISITGVGSIASPYVITNSSTVTVDGSETKINQGSNINIAGTGTVANPYVINAIIPASAVQVNSDWSAISGPAQILNKPSIPSAQVNSDWNSISGPSMILNKPALSNTNLGYIANANGGQVTSSTGSFADIPLFDETNAGLMSQQVLNSISEDSNNIKTEILIDMPTTESNDSFAQKINQLPLFSVSANQIPTFKAVKTEGENPVVFYVELIGKGKGSYGLTGVQLAAQDVKVTSFVLSSGALELEPTTQIIELGVSAVSVLATINSSLPNIVIQNQSSGYVVIKGTFNSQTYEEYLWIGAGNIYGSGATQAVLSDLKRINDIVVTKAESNYSGTVKTNFTVADPVVYLKESTDQLLLLKQNNLVSGTNIKTINGNSLLGSGNIILVTDISGKEDIANKQNSLATDSTNLKYPTVTAVNAGIAAIDMGNVKLAGEQSITGQKTFNSLLGKSSIFIENAFANSLGLQVDNSNTSSGIRSNNSSTGSGIVSNQTSTGTGLNYVGQNNGTNTFTVNKTGDIVGNTYTGGATLTGTPTAPTATAGTNTTQVATTAFVLANAQPTIPQLESNATDLTVWNNGKGNASNNTSFGEFALRLNSGGVGNTAIGTNALSSNVTGSSITAIGSDALSNITGSNNITAIGGGAGKFFNVNSPLTNAVSSIFIGGNSRALGDSQTNQIVIGVGAVGAGSNTATLGDGSITKTILRGAVETNGSFINSTAPATNVLLAGGGTLAQTGLPISTATQTALDGKVSGSGTINFISKFTGSGTVGNSAIFESAGNVGIGTITPKYRFQLRQGTNQNLQFRNSDYGSVGGVLLQASDDADFASIPFEFGASKFSFNVGNVLINTTADNGSKLQVAGAATFSSTVTADGQINAKNQLAVGNGVSTANSSINFLGVFGSSFQWNLYNDNNGFTIFSQAGVNALRLNASSGAATFASTVTAAGATLTGALNGTSASFSSSVLSQSNGFLANKTSNGTSATPFYDNLIKLNDASFQTGIQVGNAFNSTTGTYLKFMVNSTAGVNTPIDALTLLPSGAATFSSSVTAESVNSLGSSTTDLTSATFTNTNVAANITKASSLLFELTDTVNTRKPVGTITAFAEDINVVNGGLRFKTRTSDAQITALTLAGTGSATFSSSVTAVNGQLLGGTGTTNFLPKFTGAGTLGNSIASDNGSVFTLTTPTNTAATLRLTQTGWRSWDMFIRAAPASPSFVIRDASLGVDRLEITESGAATFSSSVTAGALTALNLAGTGTRSVVADASGNLSTTASVDSRPYKVYVAKITQSGTAAPVATVLENNFGLLVTWTRLSAGTYAGTFNGTFNSGKTISFLTDASSYSGSPGAAVRFASQTGGNNIIIITTVNSVGAMSDSVLGGMSLEFREYN